MSAWITIFRNEWGDLAKIFTSDEVTIENHCRIASRVIQIVIPANPYIILFLTRYFMPWKHKSAKKSQRSLISPLSPRAFFSDLGLFWRHHTWSVRSCERVELALWRHIRRLFLHAHREYRIPITRYSRLSVLEYTILNKFLINGREVKLAYWYLNKWLTSCRRHFKIQFIERKLSYFGPTFTEVCYWGSKWQ